MRLRSVVAGAVVLALAGALAHRLRREPASPSPVPRIALPPASKLKASRFEIYRSNDHGVSWVRAHVGPPADVRIHALATRRDWSFAGSDDGVFVSTDSGATWTKPRAQPDSPLQSFARRGPMLLGGSKRSGVLALDESGDAWQPLGAGLADLNVRALVAVEGDVFAGTDTAGVFRLAPGAAHWTPFGDAWPVGAQVFDLAVTPESVYAALYSRGLYRAPRRGRAWARVADVEPLRLQLGAGSLVVGHNPGGVFRSTDAGVTWQAGQGLSPGAPIWALGAAGPHLLAGTSPGTLMISSDAGATWRSGARGLPQDGGVSAVYSDGALTLAVAVSEP